MRSKTSVVRRFKSVLSACTTDLSQSLLTPTGFTESGLLFKKPILFNNNKSIKVLYEIVPHYLYKNSMLAKFVHKKANINLY